MTMGPGYCKLCLANRTLIHWIAEPTNQRLESPLVLGVGASYLCQPAKNERLAMHAIRSKVGCSQVADKWG